MVNRSLIRQKVVQVVYMSALDNCSHPLLESLKYLNQGLDSTYRLYHTLLYLLVEVNRYAVKNISHRDKFDTGHVSSEERLFIKNLFIGQLSENASLKMFFDNETPQWIEESNLIESLYDSIKQSDALEQYATLMQSAPKLDTAGQYAADKSFVKDLYKEVFVDNETLDNALEEQDVYWRDDKDYLDSFVLKTIKGFNMEAGADQALLPMYADNGNYDFAEKLLTDVTANLENYMDMISVYISDGWDKNRIPVFDMALIATAVSEMSVFTEIPAVVTINEYVELAKSYSTPKSASFVNGVLDNIRKKLQR